MAVSPRISPAPAVNEERSWLERLELGVVLPPLVLSAVVVWCVTFSIGISGWASNLDVVVRVALGALLVGTVLARVPRLPAWAAHPLSLALAIIWVVMQVGPLLGPDLPTWFDQGTDLLIRTIVLVRVLNAGGRGEDIVLFVTAVALIAWALGYVTAWLLFRRRAAWLASLLNGVVFLLNYTWVLPKDPHTLLFALLLAAALLLVVQQYVSQQQQLWRTARIEFPDLLTWRFWAAAALVVLLLGLSAALIPGELNRASADSLWRRMGEPVTAIRETWEDAFATINAPPGSSAAGFAVSGMSLGGARQLDDELVMVVESPVQEYWRAVTYDRYTGVDWPRAPNEQIWISTVGDRARAALGIPTAQQARTRVPANTPIPLGMAGGAQRIITQTISLEQTRKDDVLIFAGAPLMLGMPARIQHGVLREGGALRPNYDEISGVFASVPLRAGTTYTVSAMLAIADRQGLRAAGSDYPGWVAGTYLQLPESVSQRTRDLAAQIVQEAGATTPYSATIAIEQWLRTSLDYDQAIQRPPPGTDPVDYFLFESRRGYCDYFASAMVVMLRSQGIPARIAAGYAAGEREPGTGRYLVRENVAHSWPEVYFPGYGWQRFEPTPAGYTFAPNRPEAPLDAGLLPDHAGGPAIDGSLEAEERDLLGLNDEPLPSGASGVTSRDPLRTVTAQVTPVILLALALAGGVAWWWQRRELEGLRPAARAYAVMGRLGRWAGAAQRETETPREYGSVLKRIVPDQARAIDTIINAYTAERYQGPQRLRVGMLEEALDAVWRPLLRRAVRRILRKG